MRRRSAGEEHQNHERWLISYSDFITLMFAFFVVMFATSEADRNKAQQVSESVTRALEHDQLGDKIRQILGGQPRSKESPHRAPAAPGKLAELTPSLKRLTKELEDEIRSGKLQVSLEPRGLVVSLKEAAIFPTAEDTISSDAFGILEKVTQTIGKLPNPVRLEGHTDSRPISNQRFRDNWDLSGARSVAMLHVLVQKFGVPPSRLAAVAYADTLPVASNDTDEGRARNRRVDIAILNEYAALKEAQPVAAHP